MSSRSMSRCEPDQLDDEDETVRVSDDLLTSSNVADPEEAGPEQGTTVQVRSPHGWTHQSQAKLNADATKAIFSKMEAAFEKPHTRRWHAFSLRTRKFYEAQNAEIENLRQLNALGSASDEAGHISKQELHNLQDKIVTYASAIGNIILLTSLLIAFISSGAMSIVASVVDSGLDNVSIIVIFLTARAKRNVNADAYPQGKERMEPVGVMVFSCIMAMSSLLLIYESVRRLIESPMSPPDATKLSLGLVGGDIGMKTLLYLVCRRYAASSANAAALTQDHRNDIVLNSTAILTTAIAANYWAPLDSIGAICIALWTGSTWGRTCYQQMQLLTGSTASPEFLRELTYICLTHDTRIVAIDTVRAFHFGTRFLVELDIMLPANMTLRETHDIGESLQQKVERLDMVERAFVHVDFETSHKPTSEHKQWGLPRHPSRTTPRRPIFVRE